MPPRRSGLVRELGLDSSWMPIMEDHVGLEYDTVILLGGLGKKFVISLFTFNPEIPTRSFAKVNLDRFPLVKHAAGASYGPRQVIMTGGIYRFHSNTNKIAYAFAPALPVGRWGHGMAALRSTPFVVGGSTSMDGVQKSLIFLDKGSWRTAARMKKHRSNFALISSRDQMVAVGGQGKTGSYLGEVELYDSMSDSWSSLNPLLEPRIGLRGIFLANGSLMVTGGRNEAQSVVKTVSLYDPREGQWTEGPEMRKARLWHGLIEVDGAIKALGGDDSSTVEVYDARNRSWTVTPESLEPIYGSVFLPF